MKLFNPTTWRSTILIWLLVSCDENAGPNLVRNPEVSAIQSTNSENIFSPIVRAARSQIGKTTSYDPSYVGLSYPGGDVPLEKGVCTDVVIRALRGAVHLDLQKLVHEDMKIEFSAYPNIWGLKKPDPNIDHRRVPNLKTYFNRRGFSLPVTRRADDYLAGDLVTCTVGRNLAHIMIVSDKNTASGVPFVIHNIGSGTKEEDRLFEFPITGHYRVTE
ncbi:MAG: DUF1287 domain-containing protein [Opitutae bacterium]|nr:DUF1287 domain-containing protein [Opitutae bacterium]